LNTDTTGKDFAILPNTEAVCTQPNPVPGKYEIKLAECKPGQVFVVEYKDDETKIPPRVASITPVRNDLPRVPMIEKITWNLPSDGHQLKLVYDDVLPYGVQVTPVPGDVTPADATTCLVDPRVAANEFTLASAYDTYAERTAVLRPGQTSCLIKAVVSSPVPAGPGGVPPATGGTYVAYVYSAIDGWRTSP
jgi:hypothetical protein